MEGYRIHKIVLGALNAMFVNFIPKKEWANSPEWFRPIAIYNISYKIILNVLAHKLKYLLPFIILTNQVGYVEGR